MLDTAMKQQLEGYFKQLEHTVELVVYLDASAKSKEIEQLVEELSSLSPRVQVRHGSERDGVRYPSLSIAREGQVERVHFAGVPMGHEFNSLILSILQAGGKAIKLSDDEVAQIKALEGEFTFETYISLSCQNCPDVVQALNLLAALNPNIEHTMIDGALFQEEVDARNIMSVPATYLNGEPFSQGRIALQEVLNRIDTGAQAKQAEALSAKEVFDLLVVGGGPAGAAAAIYAARKGIRTGVVTERFGGQVLDTVGIENFISVKETTGPKLVQSLEQHVLDYDVDVMTQQRVVGLSQSGTTQVELENGAVLSSKTVLLSTGARWREMGVPGEQEYKGRGVAYCPHCDGPLFKGKRVAVIGGGNSGIEAAIDLAGIVDHVTVLEFDNKLRADAVLQEKANALPNVDIILSAQTTEVVGNGERVTQLNYKDRDSGAQHEVPLEGVFVQIGLVPNTDWLGDSVELNPRGEIMVNERGQTSLVGVFAAGDVTASPYKQIIIAMGAGANAALGAFDHLIRQ